MPSTYTLNNGIELIGTGEQSGTWGDTTNTNFGLIDVALDGQTTVTLASAGSSGSPNALPISDGAASNGRNRMVVFDDSSDLGATAYVQLTPNDAEKIIYIRNDLSGSRSIILFQGTYNASNDYEVPAGTTAVVYFDGAGSGAVAANVFNNAYFDSLRLGGVSVTAILDEDNMASDSATALATQQSIKAYVDATAAAQNELSEVLANGNTTGGTDIAVSTGDDITFADSSKAIFGAGSDLQIYHDGSNSYINDVGAGQLIITSDGTQGIYLQKGATETLAAFKIDGSVDLYYDNSKKLATTSTGIDVTGTVTADGLTVDGGTGVDLLLHTSAGVSRSVIEGEVVGGSGGKQLFFTNDGGGLKKRMQIDHLGDISFYEDTGTTPKFFWDASAERLGIGTTSPTQALDVSGNMISNGRLILTNTGSSADTGSVSVGTLSGGFYANTPSGKAIYHAVAGTAITYSDANTHWFKTAGSEAMRIDSSGNVGIGTSSPSEKLHVSGSILIDEGDAAGNPRLYFDHDNFTGSTFIEVDRGSQAMEFWNQGSEAMRIDASGNLLVGTTDDNPSNNPSGDGIALKGAEGLVMAAATKTSEGVGAVGYFNRLSTDGPVIYINRDGVTAGNIGMRTAGSDKVLTMTFDSGAFGVGLTGTTPSSYAILPADNGTSADGTVSLGVPSVRFKDIYLSGGVYLGGTGAANKLDDYEEGAWTPTVKGETTAGTATYLGRWGNYTKIGNLVTVRFYLNVNSFNGTGVMRISGLPFTSGADNGIAAGGINPVRVNGTISLTTDGVISLAIVEGSTEAIFFSTSVTTNANSSAVDCDAAWAGQFEGSYFV